MDELSKKEKLLHDIRNALAVINASAGEIEITCKKPFRINEMLINVERQTKSVEKILELLKELEAA